MSADTPISDQHDYIWIVCLHCGYQFKVPVYCGNRFCAICGSPRRKRIKNRLQWLVHNRPRKRGTMLKHLTLTVINDADLPTMVKHLIKSFRKVRNRKYFKTHITGGAFVIELTHKGNLWHAHIHCIIQSYRIDWNELQKMWYQCTGGSRGVYIKNIPPAQAINYLTAYITKSELPEEYQLLASSALKNYRLFNPFGSWYALNKEYKPPLCKCPECNQPSSMMPYDLIYTLPSYNTS